MGLLEFTGAGVGAIQEELTSIELAMAQLGSRMLAPETNINETATAATIKSMSENSTLASIVRGLNKQLTKLWGMTLAWAGSPDEDASVQLNFDFLPAKLAGNDLTAVVSAWQTGAISKETLFYNLQQGEVVASDLTFDDEEARIEGETPEGAGIVEPTAQELLDAVAADTGTGDEG